MAKIPPATEATSGTGETTGFVMTILAVIVAVA